MVAEGIAQIFPVAPPHWRIPIQDYQRQRLLVYFGADFAAGAVSPKEKAEALNQTSTEEYRALLGSNLHASR